MDLNRRFAEGYKMLMGKYGEKRPAELEALEERLLDYQKTLHKLGLRDYQVRRDEHWESGLAAYAAVCLVVSYWMFFSCVLSCTQVPTLQQDDFLKLFYTITHLLLVWTLATLPSLVLNAPVGVIVRVLSSREQKKALAASRVKIEAKDVVMSKKISLSIVLVPTLWITYAILLLKYTDLPPETIAVLFLCCPLFSYIGVMATEAGMVDMKDLKPVIMRLLPGARRRMATLPAERAQLQREIRAYIHHIGPDLGSLYLDKQVRWDEIIRNGSSTGDLQNAINEAAAGRDTPPPTTVVPPAVKKSN